MSRKRRPFIRESAVRDARLIIIASEDSKATVSYFETFISPSYFQSSRIHVEVLKRDETTSAPEYILDQINQWLNKYQIGEGDEFWLVVDVDRWGDAKLSSIAQECNQKDIDLAISNPAIELWFLLHLDDVNQYSELEQKELFENARVNANRTRLEQAILNILGSYNKRNLDADSFVPHVHLAIERAKRLDIQPEDRWPQQLGTRVYLLAESILNNAN